MKQLRTVKKETRTKYYRLINECHQAKDFEVAIMRKRHHVGNVIFQAMHECNIITIKNNRATWIAHHVTDPMLNEILVAYEKIKRRHKAAELLRKNNIDPKKVIAKPQQPISKPQLAQVIEPTPLNKPYVPVEHVAEIHANERALRNAFIAGFVIGVLISCAVAAMW